MRPIRLLCLVVLLAWILAALPGRSSGQVLEQTFSENLADFSISTPNAQWTFAPRSITPGPLRATLRFQSSVDQFVPNVTVRVTASTNPQTLLKDIIANDLKALPQEVEILSKKSIRHDSVEGYEIEMRDMKARVLFIQWIFLANGKIFVVTGAAKESTWPRFEGDMKKILNSFQIR
jgi:photosystem II reaction center protein PsbP